MSERVEMLEATLDLFEEGVAVLDGQGRVVFWSRAAEALTGYRRADVLFRACPAELYRVDEGRQAQVERAAEERAEVREGMEPGVGFGGAVAGYTAQAGGKGEEFLERAALVAMRHHAGHTLPAMLRRLPLRDALGERTGAALLFRPVEEVDGLPHGASGEGVGVERSQADLEDRLDEANHQWLVNQVPFGLLWMTVDQAAGLRRTHGREACEAMLGIVEHALVRGLRPTEIIGRWGDDEFLVLSHERTAEMLGEHAERLGGLVRGAEFKWWGDRVGLTVSIGASQARVGERLQPLMERVRELMRASLHAGGN